MLRHAVIKDLRNSHLNLSPTSISNFGGPQDGLVLSSFNAFLSVAWVIQHREDIEADSWPILSSCANFRTDETMKKLSAVEIRTHVPAEHERRVLLLQ